MSSDSLLHLLASMRREERANIYCTWNEMRHRNLNAHVLSMASNVPKEFSYQLPQINVYENLSANFTNRNSEHIIKYQEDITKIQSNITSADKQQSLEGVSNETHKDSLTQTERDEMDEDKHFSMMLVPMFKKLNEEQKHYAKIEILNVMNHARHYQPQLEQQLESVRPNKFRIQEDNSVITQQSNCDISRTKEGCTTNNLTVISEPASVRTNSEFQCLPSSVNNDDVISRTSIASHHAAMPDCAIVGTPNKPICKVTSSNSSMEWRSEFSRSIETSTFEYNCAKSDFDFHNTSS
ncbi:uncharacterized protein LOC128200845 [Galleria mellonella]|uniref:Uncharacterized protein LOC128200845 n=1 Tax=Galleria mellonella TaxID=7137 RepID=A0ABM3MJH3_GALME|nr:uncharacterized protein LOC128200845 [Galleria mellonella]